MKADAGVEPDRSPWVGADACTRFWVADQARQLARSMIPLASKRWRHVETAAMAAEEAAQVLDAVDGAVLVGAAWLHDIGYHHPTAPTGFHPLDGAQLVRDAGWSARIAALVAHHSEARFMAAARGLTSALEVWPREAGPVTDALVYADMTSAPAGGRTGLRERLIDVRRRHAREAPERAAARRLREPHLVLAAARVDIALLEGGHRAHFALPARHLELQPEVVGRLAFAHPSRSGADLRAAVHASASLADNAAAQPQTLVLGAAHRLLLASMP